MRIPVPPETIAHIARELAVKAQANGRRILGSQLGKLVNDSLSPAHVRDFGGLRSFAQEYLHVHVRLVGKDDASADLWYDIVEAAQRAVTKPAVPETVQAVAGAELWRYFSNPRLDCSIGAQPSGTVWVAPVNTSLPQGTTALKRFGVDRYRALARRFRDEHDAVAKVVVDLDKALAQDSFYGEWIAALRKHRTGEQDMLRSWEILRTSEIAKALGEELAAAGVDASRVAEIVQLARPVGSAARTAKSSWTLESDAAHGGAGVKFLTLRMHPRVAASSAAPVDEVAQLRQMVHRAVDQMSAAELSEIRLTAGTLLKLTSMING
ncbi:MAG: hypothetical protein ACK50K_18700 [Betaproteobacteria bacterium]|jgi:hypothetical protein|nr:hypothetical protein [Rubrivivax sp.]